MRSLARVRASIGTLIVFVGCTAGRVQMHAAGHGASGPLGGEGGGLIATQSGASAQATGSAGARSTPVGGGPSAGVPSASMPSGSAGQRPFAASGSGSGGTAGRLGASGHVSDPVASAGARSSGSGGSAADAGIDPLDPNAGATADMCADAICFDVFDCVFLHPDLLGCNFTDCVDFACR